MRGTDRRPVRRYAAIAAAAAIGLSVAACSGPSAQVGPSASATAHATPPVTEVKITPANGSSGVSPSRGITVTATEGRVTNVTVTASGDRAAP